MGSDPRRLEGLRADEQVAARLVERATGATARAHEAELRAARAEGAAEAAGVPLADGRPAKRRWF